MNALTNLRRFVVVSVFSHNYSKSSLPFAQKSAAIPAGVTAAVSLTDYVTCLNSLPGTNTEAERYTW